MNTTTVRIVRCTGAGLAGVATSWVLAAPVLAMQPALPDPAPGSAQHLKIFDSQDGRGGPAAATPATTSSAPASDGVDWSTLAAVLGGAAMLTGVAFLGRTQIHRHQAHPA